MGRLASAIKDLFTAQRAYDEAMKRHASSEELLVLAEAMRIAIIAHGEAMQATPRTQWEAEANAAMIEAGIPLPLQN